MKYAYLVNDTKSLKLKVDFLEEPDMFPSELFEKIAKKLNWDAEEDVIWGVFDNDSRVAFSSKTAKIKMMSGWEGFPTIIVDLDD